MGGSGPVLGVRNATRQLATLRSGRAGRRRLNLTSTTGTGVPIYWLNGNKIADNYADFYDGGWDDETNPRNEAGELISGSAGLIWTGCNHDGTAKSGLTLGDSGGFATFGELNHGSHGPLSSDAIGGTSAQGRLYAISRIYTVREAGIATASIVSTPRHAARGYLAGEEIRVRLGFNEPVNVTEANQPPSVWLKVDNEVRRAWYVSGSGTANLEFAYTVQRGDSDSNGVGLCSDTALEDTCGRIAFNGGTVTAVVSAPSPLEAPSVRRPRL